jgi:hypothetical protein
LDMGSCELFASNCDPPDLSLPSSEDYRHEQQAPSDIILFGSTG